MAAKPRSTGDAALFELPALTRGLPEPPPVTLDPYLDAAARCFARHGIRRTSVQDVARELRVNRTTVYRQVGGVDHLARLLLARDLHRALALLPTTLDGTDGPTVVVRVLTTLVKHAREHPVAAKVLRDEPEIIGPFLTEELPDLVGRVAEVLRPLLEFAMGAGVLARRDAGVVAEWLVRIGISALLAPPPDLEGFFAEVLVPALTPEPKERR